MKKVTALKLINPIIAVLLLNQACTALLHDAMGHDAYEVFHVTGGFLLVAGAILHLILNWNWVKATYFKKKGA